MPGHLERGVRVLAKVLLLSMLLFVAVGAAGIWLRRRRGR
jgi:hypothetical protein